MKSFFLAIGTLCAICGAIFGSDRPNIVLIFADDFGWQEPSFCGHTGFFGKCHMKATDDGKSGHPGFVAIKHSKAGINSDDPTDPKAIFAITDA